MKNVLTTTAIALLLGVTACKNVDEKLVSELQQSTTVLESSKPASDSAAFNLDVFRAKMANVTPEKAIGATYVVSKISEKVDRTMADYNETKATLAALLADYEAGKITKEDVEKKYAPLKNKIDNYERAFQKISNIMQRPSDDLVKMGEDMARSEGVDLTKPVAQDRMGGGDAAPAVPAGDASTISNGATKKKD
jgi:hypothetical protein